VITNRGSLDEKDGKGLGGTGEQTIGVDDTQLLLKGSVLKNVKYVVGVVVYTGNETKMRMNAQGARSKMSNFNWRVNLVVAILFLGNLVVVSIHCVVEWYLEKDMVDDHKYLFFIDPAGYRILLNFLGAFVFYSYLIPVSMFVTIELSRLVQAFFMSLDEHMTDCTHFGSDGRAFARTSSLNEELGMIEHIFCDKTGTLTQNKMVFKSCSFGTNVYDNPDATPPVGVSPPSGDGVEMKGKEDEPGDGPWDDTGGVELERVEGDEGLEGKDVAVDGKGTGERKSTKNKKRSCSYEKLIPDDPPSSLDANKRCNLDDLYYLFRSTERNALKSRPDYLPTPQEFKKDSNSKIIFTTNALGDGKNVSASLWHSASTGKLGQIRGGTETYNMYHFLNCVLLCHECVPELRDEEKECLRREEEKRRAREARQSKSNSFVRFFLSLNFFSSSKNKPKKKQSIYKVGKY
jgi:magnesium-transporting ATPase (P-type)